MTKQEYDAIMQEMKTHTLPHRYVSVEGARPHLEEMAVVGYDAIAGILGMHITRSEAADAEKTGITELQMLTIKMEGKRDGSL